MRLLNVFILMSLFSCTSYRQSSTPTKPIIQSRNAKQKLVAKKSKTRAPSKGNAVWHMVHPESAELYLQHESGSTELIRVETKLSDINLTPGSWQIIGLVWQGQEYDSLEEGAKFEFTILEKAPSYVGSFVVQCPKVEPENLSEIRKMEFFNRFQFTSPQGTCEMLVGNDIVKVRRAWSKLEKVPPKRLQLAF